MPGAYRWTLFAAFVLLFFPFVFADVAGALITAAAIAFSTSLLGASLWCTEPGCTLTFALADVNDDGTHDGIDLSLELRDKSGNAARLELKDFSYLQPRLRAQYMKADILNSIPAYETVFQTFFFPLSNFVQKNPLFEPADIESITFIFDQTKYGQVVLDDIGIRVPVRTGSTMETG